MPLYDYQCAACGTVFEVEHAMGARPRLKCAACGSTRVNKLFNAAGVHFTGSGFYVTDSRPAADSKARGRELKAESKSDPGLPDGRSDSQPASKAEPKSSQPEPVSTAKH